MNKNTARIRILGAMGLAVVGAIFLLTGQVYAQDEPQPLSEPGLVTEQTQAVEPIAEPIAEPVVDLVNSDLLVNPDSSAVLQEEFASVEQDDPLEVETSLAEPVLVDETGEPLSLASRAAAEADPYFTCADDSVDGTPDGICQYFGLSGIQDAIADFSTRLGSGNIFIEDASLATDYTGAVVVNGIPGLTGLIGVSTLTSSPSSLITLNGSINVSNQLAGFTLSGLTVSGDQAGALVDFSWNTGLLTLLDLVIKNTNASGDALSVFAHTGNVSLNEVKADLNGDEGADIAAFGNVAITNSSFDSNSGNEALLIDSGGSVTLNGVSASNNNAGDGVNIFAVKGVTVRNSVFTYNHDGIISNLIGDGLVILPGSKGAILIENSDFSNNQETGLLVNVDGSVTLKNLQISYNQYNGAWIDNCGSYAPCSFSASPVTLNAVSITGSRRPLFVFSNGNISLTGVNTWYASTDHNTELRNEYATAPRTVSVTNSDFSYGNNGSGLYIISRGAVSLNKVTSISSTNGNGVFIDNRSGTAGVTLINTLGNSVMDSNFAEGLFILSNGAISVTGVGAANNRGHNFNLDTTSGSGSVTLASATSYGSQTTDGIQIFSGGSIILKNVDSSSNNFGRGAFLDNSLAALPSGVTINTSTFSSNFGTGLEVSTRGSVAINGITANLNTNTSNGALITTTAGSGNVSVTNGIFNDNTQNGLKIDTLGTITLSKITANYNALAGVDLLGNKPITITGMDVSYNVIQGLKVLSNGAVKITDLTAKQMSGGTNAVYIETAGGVTLAATGSFVNSISNNYNNGLTILSGGAISLKNLNADWNVNGYGANLDNSSSSASVTIINSDFNNNHTYGLQVVSNGAVTGTNIHANDNLTKGASLILPIGSGGVTVNGGTALAPNSFTNNPQGGLEIQSNGSIVLVNITANYNHFAPGTGYGVLVLTTLGNISLTNITANGNGATGVTAASLNGILSLTNGVTNGNNTYGTFLDNSLSPGAKSITVKSLTSDSTQGFEGLYINSTGNVLLTSIQVINAVNSGGVYIDNRFGSAASSITINSPVPAGSSIVYNHGRGAMLYSDGPIILSNLRVEANFINGIQAENQTGSGGISLSKVNIDSSRNYGLIAYSTGIISLSSVNSLNNGTTGLLGWGAYLDNTYAASKITVSGSNFSSNYNSGLYATSNGPIVMTNVIAENNSNGRGFDLASPASISILSTGGFQNLAKSNRNENVWIVSGGDVVVQNLKAQYNTSGSGIMLDNTGGSGKITISGVYVDGNKSNGLDIYSNGAVSISNTTAYQNNGISSTGIYLINSGGISAVSLVNVTSTFNSFSGLMIQTSGNTTLDKVNILTNSITGAQINIGNMSSTLTISRSKFDGNHGGGLNAQLGGNVVLNNVSASNNSTAGSRGMFINNSAGSGTVTIISTYGGNVFNNNGENGLYVFSTGVFKGSNITANDNAFRGFEVYNQFGTGGVTITGGNFNRNSRSGIYLTTSGDVLISGVSVIGNGFGDDVPGIYVTNGGNITLSNSVTTGNGAEGLYAVSGSPATILIYKSLFFGNNRYSPYVPTPNITALNGTLTIVR